MAALDRVYKPLERLDWPILTLELRRCARSDRGLYYSPLIALACTVAFLIGAAAAHGRGDEVPVVPTIAFIVSRCLQAAFFLAIVPSACSRAISTERESGRFEALALTSLSSREIVVQKIALPVVFALVIWVVSTPMDVLAVFSNELGIVPLIMSFSFVVASVVTAAIGILSSTMCASSRSASAVTTLMMLFTWFALSAVMSVIAAVCFINPSKVSPIVYCVLALSILTVLVLGLLAGAVARLESLRSSV